MIDSDFIQRGVVVVITSPQQFVFQLLVPHPQILYKTRSFSFIASCRTVVPSDHRSSRCEAKPCVDHLLFWLFCLPSLCRTLMRL
ncbi:hypothetical protein Q1695_011423 [Nippostrongylus brasiliensis]|nr:hypothetical protein Q1695_011423 [Nippostrongylus brasiliensis]